MSEVKFWNGVYWDKFKEVICPRCKHYILIGIYSTLDCCELCGKWFYTIELSPYYNTGNDCYEDPKRYKRDWIIQEEELELSRMMGNKV